MRTATALRHHRAAKSCAAANPRAARMIPSQTHTVGGVTSGNGRHRPSTTQARTAAAVAAPIRTAGSTRIHHGRPRRRSKKAKAAIAAASSIAGRTPVSNGQCRGPPMVNLLPESGATGVGGGTSPRAGPIA